MKNFSMNFKTIYFIFLFPIFITSQITLENIWGGKYYQTSIHGIQSMKDGKYYTVLGNGGIEKFSYETQENKGMIASGSFSGYQFNNDESYLILETESEPIYRHSKLGKYSFQKIGTTTLTPIANGAMIQEPTFSPDSKNIVYMKDNNLFIQNIATNSIIQITNDGKKNAIINGINDWVYEEEFGHVKAFEWSANGENLVFVKFDESNVKQLDIPIYYQNLYPEKLSFKYPKAGEENSKLSLYSYNLNSKKTININLSGFQNYYIPLMKSSNKADKLFVLTTNRHQNSVDVLSINPSNGNVSKLFTETDKAWIETDNFTIEFLANNSFLWTSERNGFRHIYLYDENGNLKNQVTKGNWEVTKVYGADSKGNVYYQSAEFSPKNREINKISINGTNKVKLSENEGFNEAEFSKDFSYFINNYSTKLQPKIYALYDNSAKKIKVLEENTRVANAIKSDEFTQVEFLQIPNEAGVKLEAWMIKPKNFNSTKKYPLFMYLYGGPGSQEVDNNFDGINGSWFQLLAQKGYIVLCVDGRGTGFRGSEFKKQTYKDLGNLEIQDQIAVAKYMQAQTYIDGNRIGMFGWSYGGYMTLLAMTKGADIFKVGISVAPVTNWRYYDTIYTERFLQTPQENPKGYDENSPINFANKLKGKLLMIHGTGDDNVHFQNSLEMSEAFIQADKAFEQAYYPDKNHGIYGGKTRIHLYKKMTEFILNNL